MNESGEVLVKVVVPILVVILTAYLGYFKYIQENKSKQEESTRLLIDSLRGEIKGVREQLKLVRLSVNHIRDRGKFHINDQDLTEFKQLLDTIPTPVMSVKIEEIGFLKWSLARHVLQLYADFNSLKLQLIRLTYSAEENRELEYNHFAYDVKRWIQEATDLNRMLEWWITEKTYPPWKPMRERGEKFRRPDKQMPTDFDQVDVNYLSYLENEHPKSYDVIKTLYADLISVKN